MWSQKKHIYELQDKKKIKVPLWDWGRAGFWCIHHYCVILESPSLHCNCFMELSCTELITLYNLSMLETESKLCRGTVPFTAATVHNQVMFMARDFTPRAAHPVRHLHWDLPLHELGMEFESQSFTIDCVKISPKCISINAQFCTKNYIPSVCWIISQYSEQWSKPEASPPKLPFRSWATKDSLDGEEMFFKMETEQQTFKLFRLHFDQQNAVINTFANYSHYADKNNSAINNRNIN